MTEPLRCDEFVELVTPYLDGTLDPETRARVEADLEVCEGCSTYLAQIRQTIAAMGDVPADDLPDEARERLLNAFRQS
jgi:anti-sigma factor RsiW